MRDCGVLYCVLMKLLLSDSVLLHHLIGDDRSHSSAIPLTKIQTIDQRQILDLLVRDISELLFIPFLRDQLRHQLRLHRLVIRHDSQIKLRHAVHLLHDGLLRLMKDIGKRSSAFMGFVSQFHVQVPFHRGITVFEGNPPVGFSLELLHISDPDLYAGILRRKFCGEVELQILFHLFQKSVIRHKQFLLSAESDLPIRRFLL